MEKKDSILKNIIWFFVSLCPIFTWFILIFILKLYLRLNGIYLTGDNEIFILLIIAPATLFISIAMIPIAIIGLGFTVKSMIDMIKNKKMILIPIIEITIYILILVYFVLICTGFINN